MDKEASQAGIRAMMKGKCVKEDWGEQNPKMSRAGRL